MWFTETPWPPIVVCLIVSAMLIIYYFSTKRAVPFIIAMLLLGGCVGIYLVEQSIVTTAEIVEQEVHGLTSAYQQGDKQKTLDYFSKVNAAPERAWIDKHYEEVEVSEDLRITDLQVEMKAKESQAITDFRANATISVKGHGSVGRHPSRWRINWQKEGGEWKVVKVMRIHPINGEKLDYLASQ